MSDAFVCDSVCVCASSPTSKTIHSSFSSKVANSISRPPLPSSASVVVRPPSRAKLKSRVVCQTRLVDDDDRDASAALAIRQEGASCHCISVTLLIDESIGLCCFEQTMAVGHAPDARVAHLLSGSIETHIDLSGLPVRAGSGLLFVVAIDNDPKKKATLEKVVALDYYLRAPLASVAHLALDDAVLDDLALQACVSLPLL